MPTVSVVVPSYNHSGFLRTAIESVQAQTFEDWELVIVDDVSSDDSVAVARSFDDPRIRVEVNESNLGTYGTLNRALDLAQGDLVAVLNSDDFWAPEKLILQVEAMREVPEARFSYTFGTATDEAGIPKEDHHHQGLPNTRIQNPICSLLIENRILASAVMFRRGSIRFDPTVPASGDWLALLQLSKMGPAVYIDEPLTFWRHHGSNTSRRWAGPILSEAKVRRWILSDLDAWRLPGVDQGDLMRSLALCALRYQRMMVLAGDKQEAARAIRLAARLGPRSRMLWKRRLLMLLPTSYVEQRLLPGVDPAEVKEAYRLGAASREISTEPR